MPANLKDKSDIGFIYVASGEKFITEAIDSATSLRKFMPEAEITLITDNEAELKHKCFNQVVYLSTDLVAVAPTHRGYYQKIKGLSASPYEKTLFVDTDTQFADSVWELFSLLKDYDFAIASAPYKAKIPSMSLIEFKQKYQQKNYLPALNTGVICYQKSSKVRQLFQEWEQIFVNNAPGNGEYYSDQTVFCQALAKSQVRPMILPTEYNFRIGMPQAVHGRVKIFHGRPVQGWQRHIELVNSSDDYRIYISSIALLVLKEGHFEVEGFSTNVSKTRDLSYKNLQELLTANEENNG
ncbi:MAG: hypothetical protein SXA11_09360 [Cyanobacteriota bacterium]|nr:hypothetical protein [Cyanobacteriota bacterium]